MKQTRHLEFPEILKLRRERKKKSQNEVALAVGLRAGVSCSDWERGDGLPESKRLKALADYLDLTIGQLFGDADIAPDLLFENASQAEAYGMPWKEPIKPPPPKPYQPEDQEPGRFLMRVNLEDCELLSIFHQLDARRRSDLLNFGIVLLRRGDAGEKSE